MDQRLHNQLYSDNYESIQEGAFEEEDEHGFLSHIYFNRFHYEYNENYWDNPTSINVTDIAQFPTGISPFGLYDIIGNVEYYWKYWIFLRIIVNIANIENITIFKQILQIQYVHKSSKSNT